MRPIGVATLDTTLRLNTHLPTTCVCTRLRVQDLYHDLIMPVQDWLHAAIHTARRHLRNNPAVYKE